MRLLLDAGADTTSVVPGLNTITKVALRGKNNGKAGVPQEQLHDLEAIRRLMSCVEAVHAVSWLWHSGLPINGGVSKSSRRAETTSTPLRMMLPGLRRRASRRRGVLLRALFRSVVAPCWGRLYKWYFLPGPSRDRFRTRDTTGPLIYSVFFRGGIPECVFGGTRDNQDRDNQNRTVLFRRECHNLLWLYGLRWYRDQLVIVELLILRSSAPENKRQNESKC